MINKFQVRNANDCSCPKKVCNLMKNKWTYFFVETLNREIAHKTNPSKQLGNCGVACKSKYKWVGKHFKRFPIL